MKNKIIILCLLLSACVQDFEKQELDIETPKNWTSEAVPGGEYKSVDWVAAFNDPKLSEVIKEVLENNHDLQKAIANMEKAAAMADKTGADLWPQIDAKGNGGRYKSSNSGFGGGNFGSFSKPFEQFALSLDVSWEIDVWGRLRAGDEAAAYDYYAAEHDYEFARQSLVAQAMKDYFTAIETTRQLELANEFEQNMQKTLEVTEAFFDEGLVSIQDVHLVKADLAKAKEAAQAAQSDKLAALRSLEVLLGRYPSAEFETSADFPTLPAAVAAGIPSDILERRPDILAAERRVAAAFNRIYEAQTAKLPSISLTASYGASSNELNDLIDPSSVVWNVVGNLLFPIFNAGKLDAEIDIKTAEQKSAIAEFQQIALTAFSEVEAALSNEVLFRKRSENLQEAFENAKEAELIADENFKVGEIGMLDLLQIKRSTITTQKESVRMQKEVLEQRVNLHLSLGGDYDAVEKMVDKSL